MRKNKKSKIHFGVALKGKLKIIRRRKEIRMKKEESIFVIYCFFCCEYCRGNIAQDCEVSNDSLFTKVEMFGSVFEVE